MPDHSRLLQIPRESRATRKVSPSMSIFKGAVRSSNTAGSEMDVTEWAVAHDRTNLKTYVRTYGGLTIQMVDIKKIDFDQPGFRQIVLDNTFAPADITSTATALAIK